MYMKLTHKQNTLYMLRFRGKLELTDRGVIRGYLYTLLKNLLTESIKINNIKILHDLNDEEKQILNHIRNASIKATSTVEGQYIVNFLNTPEVVSITRPKVKAMLEKSLFNISDRWPVIQPMSIVEKPQVNHKPKSKFSHKDGMHLLFQKWMMKPNWMKQLNGGWTLSIKLEKNTIYWKSQWNSKSLNVIEKHYKLLKTLADHFQNTSICDRNCAKPEIRKFAKMESLRKIQKINDLLLENEVTSTKEILKARAEYSDNLASVPKIYTDPTTLTHFRPKQVKQKEPSDNYLFNSLESESETSADEEVTLTKPEFLMAIRQIQMNAAHVKSGFLAMHLKKVLEIECQLQISQDWEGAPTYGETYFPITLDYSTTQPKIWNEEILINLPKPGQDQRRLNDTRGITISCNKGKLLLNILATKNLKKLEEEKLFLKTQAGFRKGQEAVAHVAFDRVHKGYDSSKIQGRLGDQLSHPFTREIGTSQGCLSPLLFIIFVNHIFREVTEGIDVPGLHQKVPGLLFSNETLIFANTLEEIESNFIDTSIHVPCVRNSVAYLSRLCMQALPTTKECIQVMKVFQKGCSLTEYICPCCHQFFEGEEWCHYILNCKTFKKEQCKSPETLVPVGSFSSRKSIKLSTPTHGNTRPRWNSD
ncbi:hypothetical protein VP01_142g2 [Puccinia sorghi]|uniref:Reverse transcriptase domain-containing protein n=1 Tax=Puccinia sorghi TaxID=27349 RepID=A0A0L6VKY3_9BASI|nr:hypothetical protein VP01_142g2 [Puccinia sorghi]